MLKIEIWEILNQLEQNGFDAYAVGGCVRDSLLGINPKDWDITTNARPEQIKYIFPNTFDTGIRFGTVCVKWNNSVVEITTFRGEKEYENHRKPMEVYFTDNLQEDLKRRDFTVNALCADKEGHIIDLFGGREDLKNGIIRAIGNPNERFFEDALRMLRALRFACRLDFVIEPDTYHAITKNAYLLKSISAERIRAELDEIVLFDKGIRLLSDSDLYSIIFEAQPVRFNETVYKQLPLELKYRYAYLLQSAPSGMISKLKFDRRTAAFVKNVLQYQDTPLHDALSLQRMYLKIGKDALECIVLLQQDENLLSLYRSCRFLTVGDFAVNGKDILFIAPQKRSKVLTHLVEKVFLKELDNTRPELLRYINNLDIT